MSQRTIRASHDKYFIILTHYQNDSYLAHLIEEIHLTMSDLKFKIICNPLFLEENPGLGQAL